MKSKLLAVLAFLAMSLGFLGAAHPVHASGNLQIATQSGAMYLTTSPTGTSSSGVTPAPSSTPIPTSSGVIFLPPGFFRSPQDLVNNTFRVIMVIAVILVFAYLVLGGLQYITSGGEKGKTEAARNKITSAIIGLIIVASSYAILTVVLNFIGYRDVPGMLSVTPPAPIVTPTPIATPIPTPTPTPTSALQKLLNR